MARFGDLDTQYFDDGGDVLSYGKIRFYKSGTTTDKDTYADQNHAILNANPVILNADGTQPNVFFDGTVKAILYDSNDVQIRQLDPLGGDISGGAFESYSSEKNYNFPDIVTGDDNKYYKSITNGNQGNDPTADTTNWVHLDLIYTYNANATFTTDQICIYGGLLYRSEIDGNLNNQPDISSAEWYSLTPVVLLPFRVIEEITLNPASPMAEIEFKDLPSDIETFLIEGRSVDCTATGAPDVDIYLHASSDNGSTYIAYPDYRNAAGYAGDLTDGITMRIGANSEEGLFSCLIEGATQSDEHTLMKEGYYSHSVFGTELLKTSTYPGCGAQTSAVGATTALKLSLSGGYSFRSGTVKIMGVK